MAQNFRRRCAKWRGLQGSKLASCGLLFLLLDVVIVSIPVATSQSKAPGWELVPTKGATFARILSPAVYDPVNSRFEFFGGAGVKDYGDTVFYYPSNDTFVSLSQEARPSPRYAEAMSFDEACRCLVLFGGAYKKTETSVEMIYNDTWLYFPGNDSWKDVATRTAPAARHLDGMVYDPTSKVDLLFGGTDDLPYNDLWSFNTSTRAWVQLESNILTGNLIGRPVNRFAFEMAPSVGGSSFLVFGGDSMNLHLLKSGIPTEEEVNDTWEYSYSKGSWLNLTSGVHPPGRMLPASASSVQYGLTLMFGGSNYSDPFSQGFLSDTWVFDQNTNRWHELNITGPGPLVGASLGYDPVSKSFLLFGGEDDMIFSGLVWRLSVSTVLSLIGGTSVIAWFSVEFVAATLAVASAVAIVWASERRAQSRPTPLL